MDTKQPNPKGTLELPVESIEPENNDRTKFDEAALKALAESIRHVGLISPIRVRPNPDDPNRYRLIAGERRWRAHVILGKTTIEAIITDDDDRSAKMKMLAENSARVDLNPIEEAQAYAERIERFGEKLEDVAKVAGVWPVIVRDRMRLLKLAPDIQELIASGQLSAALGDAMHDLDENRQRAALSLQGKLSHMEFWALCDQMRNEQNEEPLFDVEAFALRQEEIVQNVRDTSGGVNFKEFVLVVDKLLAAYRAVVPDEGLDDEARAALRVVDATLDYRIVQVQKKQRVSQAGDAAA